MVIKVAAALHYMVEEVVGAGTEVQAALLRIFLCPLVAAAPGTLAAA